MQVQELVPAPVRQPVQARSQRTRARILDAAVEALVEHGYAGAKTNVIADQAGISQGALYKHFPTKLDLLHAALAHLLAELRQRTSDAIESDPEASTDPAGTAFRHMWNAFASPELQAGLELYLAARTDAELAERVIPIIEFHREQVASRARVLFPNEAGRNADYDGAVQALVSTLQGAAVTAAVLPTDSVIAEQQKRSIERMFRLEFNRSA